MKLLIIPSKYEQEYEHTNYEIRAEMGGIFS